MIETKYFKSYQSLKNWIKKNHNDYQYEVIFVHNGYGVEYKPLLKIEWAD
jgi:hypothetical protein